MLVFVGRGGWIVEQLLKAWKIVECDIQRISVHNYNTPRREQVERRVTRTRRRYATEEHLSQSGREVGHSHMPFGNPQD